MKIELNQIKGAVFAIMAIFLASRLDSTLEINFFKGYNFQYYLFLFILIFTALLPMFFSFISIYNETLYNLLDVYENLIFILYIISSLIFLDILKVSIFENKIFNTILLTNLYTIFGIILYFFLKFYDKKGLEQAGRKIFFKNIESYSGDKKKDKYHGKGALMFKGDEKYEGEFLNGQFYGFGTYTYGPKSISPSEKYEGFFTNGKRSGKGILTHSDQVLDGYFINGQANGYAEVKFGNGDTYKGEFKDGRKHGYGIYKFAAGEIDKGFYKKDLFIERDDD